MARAIHAIFGQEPVREGEYPQSFMVGSQVVRIATGQRVTVTRITHRTENYGDHGIGWYDVFCDGRANPDFSMAARAVAEIHYGESEVRFVRDCADPEADPVMVPVE